MLLGFKSTTITFPYHFNSERFQSRVRECVFIELSKFTCKTLNVEELRGYRQTCHFIAADDDALQIGKCNKQSCLRGTGTKTNDDTGSWVRQSKLIYQPRCARSFNA